MLTIIAVGKKHDALFLGAIEDYQKRIAHYDKLVWKLIESSGKSEAEARKEESLQILRHIGSADWVILLDESGKTLDSPALAKVIDESRTQNRPLVFVIGGAYGVDTTIKSRANTTLSYGRAVFPHQLMRVMVCEQLYRAHTILAGSKYHHS